MKKGVLACILCLVLVILAVGSAVAQCSICTRTASQLGEKPAKALNGAVVYLAAAPLLLMGVVGYKWWKSNGSR